MDSVNYMHAWCSWKLKEGIGSSGKGLRDGYEPPWGFWKFYLSSWEEQLVTLPAEPFLQPPSKWIFTHICSQLKPTLGGLHKFLQKCEAQIINIGYSYKRSEVDRDISSFSLMLSYMSIISKCVLDYMIRDSL